MLNTKWRFSGQTHTFFEYLKLGPLWAKSIADKLLICRICSLLFKGETLLFWHNTPVHTDIKGNSDGSGCKIILYKRKGFLIYEEMHKYLVIFEEAVSHIWLCNRSRLNFLIYEENLIFFFVIAVYTACHTETNLPLPLTLIIFVAFKKD